MTTQSPKTPREAALFALDTTKATGESGWTSPWTLDRALAATGEWYAALLAGTDMLNTTRDQIRAYMRA